MRNLLQNDGQGQECGYQIAVELSDVINSWLDSRGFLQAGAAGGPSAQIQTLPPDLHRSTGNDTISSRGQETFSGIVDESAAEVRSRWWRKRPSSSILQAAQSDETFESGKSNLHGLEDVSPKFQQEDASLIDQHHQREIGGKTASIWICFLIVTGIVSVVALAATLIR